MNLLLFKRLLLGISIVFQAWIVVKFMPEEWGLKKVDLSALNTYQDEEEIKNLIKNKIHNFGIKEYKIRNENGFFSVDIPMFTYDIKKNFSKGVLGYFLPIKQDKLVLKNIKMDLKENGNFFQGTKYKIDFSDQSYIDQIKKGLFSEGNFELKGVKNEIVWYPLWDLVLGREYSFDELSYKNMHFNLFLEKGYEKDMFSFFKDKPQIEQKFKSDKINVKYKDYFLDLNKFEERAKFDNLSNDVYNSWFLAEKGEVEVGIEGSEIELPFVPEKIYTNKIKIHISFYEDQLEMKVDIPHIFYQGETKVVLPEKIKGTLKLTGVTRRRLLENIFKGQESLLLEGIKYDFDLIMESQRGDIYLESNGIINNDKPNGQIRMVVKNFDIISPPATRINQEQCDLMRMYLENVSVQVNEKERNFLETTACLPPEDVGVLKNLRKYLNMDKRMIDESKKTVDIIEFTITEEDFKKEEK